MKRITIGGATAIFLSCSASVALAGDDAAGAAGEVSLWGQYVSPKNVEMYDGDDCSDFNELCANAFGLGGYVGVQVPMSGDWSIIGDATFDFHAETDSSPDTDNDDHATYAGLGFHIVNDSNSMPWGVFGILATGTTLEDDDAAGGIGGAGLELRSGNMFVQGGGLIGMIEDEDEVLDNLYFVRVGGEYALASGTIEGSMAYGIGDFDGHDEDDAEGSWVQVAINYEAPLTNNMDWFVGYQADWLKVSPDDESWNNKALFHSAKIGITIPFGGRDLPFKTPNFRAPISYADKMNDCCD